MYITLHAMKIKNHSHWAPESTPTFWINQASRAIMRRFEQRLRPLDFGMAYLPVAIALEENGSMPQRQLAEHARVEQPTMATLLMRMERDGLISRQPHPSDRRSCLISLTPKAWENLPSAKEQLAEVVEQATAGLSEDERATLIALLRHVVNNLESTAFKMENSRRS
ncbi:DNA phosphorothioation-dependent restriction protein DptG [Rhodoblastus acidophilus]|uniref:MarR family winged helix-turn-helix transcriptional regulator n=1 Tax=Rhodoblastus acidophilus TaxID=1074 RepID=UPI0022249F5C|nr:MarR family transcriptional regulator [Rhodoblastus acidophilus]MCW2314737.1 DNA phosphorothioation-dependent restriction protein DptG [Rhodoblastus acidophilus]